MDAKTGVQVLDERRGILLATGARATPGSELDQSLWVNAPSKTEVGDAPLGPNALYFLTSCLAERAK